MNVTIICNNDDLSLSLTWPDCLQIDSDAFILVVEINQILLKIYFTPILLAFMYLVAIFQKISSQTQTQLIIVKLNGFGDVVFWAVGINELWTYSKWTST